MKILVTGGAGYIGSHTVVELVLAGHEPVILDNFSNAHPNVLKHLSKLTGQAIPLYKFDVADRAQLAELLVKEQPDAVIHFAGFKAVGESVEKPLKYYRNNVSGAIVLLEEMAKARVTRVVFSSTATVYGVPEHNPVQEPAVLAPLSPYPWSKLMVEQIMRDVSVSDPEWSVVLLRYFNPVGAHPSGEIGEDSGDAPNNLMPYIAKVAVGELAKLTVFGDDYDTPDGTGRRDYLHVVDLAKAHVLALGKLASSGVRTYNLGTGVSYSVLEMVAAFERASGQKIPYVIGPRRAGDIAEFFADPALAHKELGWRAQLGLEDMCRDTWKWQSAHPKGFRTSL